MSMSQRANTNLTNGLDLDALNALVTSVKSDPANGMVGFHASTLWNGGTLSETTIESVSLGKQTVLRHFAVAVDEPHGLLGADTAPNPQEMLMTALNACMMVGYVAAASVAGITLESVQIETSGELDLRGFLGIDANVRPGYESLQYRVTLKGNGTDEQFRAVHDTVRRTSPNYFNLSQPIRLDATLVIEH